jgi:DNA-binding response OmpR family regulator
VDQYPTRKNNYLSGSPMENLAFIIEDNPDISELFKRALIAAGFHVEIIQDGGEAMLRLKTASPTLVILDMHLPKLNGGVILMYIRTHEHLKNTKVIVATADSQMGESYDYMADIVLQKPVTFSQLRDYALRIVK